MREYFPCLPTGNRKSGERIFCALARSLSQGYREILFFSLLLLLITSGSAVATPPLPAVNPPLTLAPGTVRYDPVGELLTVHAEAEPFVPLMEQIANVAGIDLSISGANYGSLSVILQGVPLRLALTRLLENKSYAINGSDPDHLKLWVFSSNTGTIPEPQAVVKQPPSPEGENTDPQIITLEDGSNLEDVLRSIWEGQVGEVPDGITSDSLLFEILQIEGAWGLQSETLPFASESFQDLWDVLENMKESAPSLPGIVPEDGPLPEP